MRSEKTTDVLILNTLVLDIRSPEFTFAGKLAGPGGVVTRPVEDMPDYRPAQYRGWIEGGGATAGGPGNTAPLMARAGLNVTVGGYVGTGPFEGFDIQGRTFHDILARNGVDTSAIMAHPRLPTGTTFIEDTPQSDRGGIVYFPNANDDFSFEVFAPAVEELAPRIVYYMYSGLSRRGDANGGRDLAEFMQTCRERGSLTLADSHTLAGNPEELIQTGAPVDAYRLLEPLLGTLDVFFTSADEARMIRNTLAGPRSGKVREEDDIRQFLDFLRVRFWKADGRARLFGVTVSDGAYAMYGRPDGTVQGPEKMVSRFMVGDVVDLVGAGDSFRAGLLSYVARNTGAFRTGALDLAEAVQMGCLTASLYIKAPLDDRYGNLREYETLLKPLREGASYRSLEHLLEALGGD